MNRTEIVKRTAHPDGICLSVWTYTEGGKFLAAGDVWLTPDELLSLARSVDQEQRATDQYQLTFDD